jgi:Na+-driven multidrug efflux pump
MKKVDATQGSLVKLIFIYTIPLILSTILQSLFSIADKAVLGNMAGPSAVAAIGATGTVTELIINGAVGLSAGTAIVLARFVGQKDEKNIRETIDTSLITSVAFGLIVAVAGFILAPVFLTLTNCPEECYGGALIYMRIYLSAAPATLLYNYGSAILRTLGDTKRPLAYITVAGAVNVVLVEKSHWISSVY